MRQMTTSPLLSSFFIKWDKRVQTIETSNESILSLPFYLFLVFHYYMYSICMKTTILIVAIFLGGHLPIHHDEWIN